MKGIVVASGYFDILHIGHIHYLTEAKKLGEKLIVIVNNDKQSRLKKGFVVMTQKERMEIIKALKPVDYVMPSIDTDGSVCKTLKSIPNPSTFANGGDRFAEDIPEFKLCKRLGIKMVFNVGGGKWRASSSFAKKAKKVGIL